MRISESLAILKQIAFLLGCVAAIYAVVVGVSFLLLPPPKSSQPIDTFRVHETIYMTPAKQIYYGRSSLRESGPKVILLGSSNTQVGFDQTKLQPLLHSYVVHNMGIGDNNVTEMRQVGHLAMETIGEEDVRKSVFVLGVWYGLFIDNRSRWGDDGAGYHETDIDREHYRYGFWRRGDKGPKVLVSDRMTDRAEFLIHPLIALEKGARLMTAGLRSLIFVRPPKIDDKVRDTVLFTEKQRAGQIAYRRFYMKVDALSDEQYSELSDFVREITERGAHVIVADLPIPVWHAAALPYEAQNRQKMARFVEANKDLQGFSYLDLRNLNDDDSFYDDAHVRPRAQAPWIMGLQDRILTIGRGTADVASN